MQFAHLKQSSSRQSQISQLGVILEYKRVYGPQVRVVSA